MMNNTSAITLLMLSGFREMGEYRGFFFFLTFLCYCVILVVNIAIIVTVALDKSLHDPMYIFLCNACVNTLYGTVGFYPRFLVDLLSPVHFISYAECMVQGFVIHSSTCGDFSILALMAYDRYLAICHPLVYHSIMTKQRISLLVCISWLLPLNLMLLNSATMSLSKLCGSKIQRIYCVNYMVGRIACSVHKSNGIIAYCNIGFYCGHAIFIVWSYLCLIRTCVRTKENRGKFIQTCVPHLISLINIIVSTLCDLMYMRFGSPDFSQSFQNFMAMEFLIVPPILNPVLYAFQLTKIRHAILRFVLHKRIPRKRWNRQCQQG